MVIRGLLAAALLASGSLAASLAVAAEEPVSAARCAVAEMSSPRLEAAPGHEDRAADPLERMTAWRALAAREPDGLLVYVDEAQQAAGDPAAVEALMARCRKENPFLRLPALAEPPAGKSTACLDPLNEAKVMADRMLARVEATGNNAELCTAIIDIDAVLTKGQRAVEQGQVACFEPQTAWTSLGSASFVYRLIAAATRERIDCTALAAKPVASL